jgi:hypothetical protein
MIHIVITPRVIIAMQMWLNLGININISMLGTIPMPARYMLQLRQNDEK